MRGNKTIVTTLPPSAQRKAGKICCAYQGLPGAWHEHALVQALPDAERMPVEYFEDVFIAVETGQADYGIVALENSQTGAIGENYDLLRRFGCYVVGRTTVEIRHCLLVNPGTAYEAIQEVYSHQQGFRQCERFLREQNWTMHVCRNTAVAAEIVRKQGGGTAAIGSRRAAVENGLEVLIPDIMDSTGNCTTFIVLSKQPEYDADSSLVAVSFSAIHRAGALCACLLPFQQAGINLMRIESRPGEGGTYRFFIELQGNILDQNMQQALEISAEKCSYFEIIGCYQDI